MEGESGVTRSITAALYSWGIQRYQIESQSGVTRSIIQEFHSLNIQGDQM